MKELPSFLSRLGGYILIPHELLHVLGYRLVGKQCEYNLGDSYVTPPADISKKQKLVGLLCPFFVFAVQIPIYAFLSGMAITPMQQDGKVLSFVIWLALVYIAGFYTLTTVGDLRRAYLLIKDKPWHSPTPFDFFFSHASQIIAAH